MKSLRRHWRMMTVVFGILLLGGFSLSWRGKSSDVSSALAEQGGDALTRIEFDAVVSLLADISLDRDALIALNPSGAQAESILSTVRTWRASHQATLLNLSRAIAEASADVYDLRQRMAMGPAEAGQDAALAQVVSALQTANGNYRSALAPLENSVNALLSTSQQVSWSAIRSGLGQSMPLRLLSLTDAQRLELSRAHRHFQLRQAAASTEGERNEALAIWGQDRSRILTTEQQTVWDSYLTHSASASAAVTQAYETLLPIG